MFARLRRHGGEERRASTPWPPRTNEEGTTAEDVYHDAARHFLDIQLDTHDVLDTKASQSFSVGSVVLPLTFALLNLGNTEVPQVAEWTLGLALAFYIGLLACAARASLVRGLEYRPNITTLGEHAATYPGPILKHWVADEYEASITKNARVLGRKARWVGAATPALYFEAVCLAVVAITSLLL